MGLDTIVRNAVKIADKATKTLQPKVTLKRWTSQNGIGKNFYAPSEQFEAIVNEEQSPMESPTGGTTLTKAYVAFLQPIPPNGADKRREPLDERDIVVLPSGVTGKIIRISGFVDKGTGRPFFSEVWLG